MGISFSYKAPLINLLKLTFPGVMLCLSTLVYAVDDTLCAPFKNARIDQSMVTMMLKAAKDGELYRIRPGSSKMGFCVNSPLGMIEAVFHDFQGGMVLKEANKQGSVMVSITVDSLQAESSVVEAILKGESFLDSEQFPDILFVSTSFERISDEKAVFKGDLTIRGVTKIVAFYVDIKKLKTEQGEDMLTIKATTTIQRSEFNMYTLNPVVGDRVSLCMTIDAYKYKT